VSLLERSKNESAGVPQVIDGTLVIAQIAHVGLSRLASCFTRWLAPGAPICDAHQRPSSLEELGLEVVTDGLPLLPHPPTHPPSSPRASQPSFSLSTPLPFFSSFPGSQSCIEGMSCFHWGGGACPFGVGRDRASTKDVIEYLKLFLHVDHRTAQARGWGAGGFGGRAYTDDGQTDPLLIRAQAQNLTLFPVQYVRLHRGLCRDGTHSGQTVGRDLAWGILRTLHNCNYKEKVSDHFSSKNNGGVFILLEVGS